MTRHAIIAVTERLGPMTVKQLAAELNITPGSMATTIRRARAHGTKFIRIADWAGDIPKYGPGPGEDVEGGTTADRIIAALSDHGRCTVAKLAEVLGLSVGAVDAAVRRLRKKRGKLHIVDWDRRIGQSGGREGAVYAAGPGRDAPKPDFSGAQRAAERRYAEKRRIAAHMNGVKPRARTNRHSITASPFDGLLR